MSHIQRHCYKVHQTQHQRHVGWKWTGFDGSLAGRNRKNQEGLKLNPWMLHIHHHGCISRADWIYIMAEVKTLTPEDAERIKACTPISLVQYDNGHMHTTCPGLDVHRPAPTR